MLNGYLFLAAEDAAARLGDARSGRAVLSPASAPVAMHVARGATCGERTSTAAGALRRADNLASRIHRYKEAAQDHNPA